MDPRPTTYSPNGPGSSRFCHSCGQDLAEADRFCRNCGASTSPPVTRQAAAESFAAGPVAATAGGVRKRSQGWLPWSVALVLVVVGTAGYLVRSSQLEEARALASKRQGTIEGLQAKAADLDADLADANSKLSALDSENSSLRNALEQCRDAAVQGERTVRSLYRTFVVSIYYGPQALRDLKDLKRALAACKVQANSNGIL